MGCTGSPKHSLPVSRPKCVYNGHRIQCRPSCPVVRRESRLPLIIPSTLSRRRATLQAERRFNSEAENHGGTDHKREIARLRSCRHLNLQLVEAGGWPSCVRSNWYSRHQGGPDHQLAQTCRNLVWDANHRQPPTGNVAPAVCNGESSLDLSATGAREPKSQLESV
jgi:hypothetical protein